MKRSEQRVFQVNIPSLKLGHHQFQYEINDEFFGQFENSLVDKGNGKVELNLKLSETMMVLDFNLDLKVELVCDRSLDTFSYPIKTQEELIVKFGEENEELSEELIVISEDTQLLDVAPYIQEYIGLSIPMKKLHPRYDGKETPPLIYQTEVNEEESKDEIDPRWEALKKLK
ncbi:MAG: DUF177 domain-containing protein [Cytophagales bacterium]|nr:DUF177 domain-containing protein [Cytophagales bacterium]